MAPFGVLEKLINIPKSEVRGAEISLQWVPIAGLNVSGGASYIKSEIKNFENYDPYGNLVDLDGSSFPNAPDLQANASVQYDWILRGTPPAGHG